MNDRLKQQKGNVLVFFAVALTLFFTFLALSVDIGWIMLTKSELQAAADSAALAGAAQLAEDDLDLARDFSQDFSSYNSAAKESIALERNDSNAREGGIVVGYLHNPMDLSDPLQTEGLSRYNTVQVVTKRSAEINGPLRLFLGYFTGLEAVSIRTRAAATLDDRVIGFDATPGGSDSQTGRNLGFLPFALYHQIWNAAYDANYSPGPDDCPRESLSDDFAYENGKVRAGHDQIPELKMYPNRTLDCGLPGAPGNFGTVDVGYSNNSTNDLVRQILEGISPEELAAVDNLRLTDNGHGVLSKMLEGDTGVSTAIKSALEQIIGQPRVIPLFMNRTGSGGDNACYEICGFVGIRIMHVQMTGPLEDRYVLIQMCKIHESKAIIHPDAPHSNSIYNLSLTR